jgi:hypothetical protein
MESRGRKIIAGLMLALALGFLGYGVETRLRVFYAREAPPDTSDPTGLVDPLAAPDLKRGDRDEGSRFIMGSSKQLWNADTSREEWLSDVDMLDKSTVSGVARTDGLLHLTGADACPT